MGADKTELANEMIIQDCLKAYDGNSKFICRPVLEGLNTHRTYGLDATFKQSKNLRNPKGVQLGAYNEAMLWYKPESDTVGLLSDFSY
eukprot:NODE_596_length_719_cov_331.228041_g587_i0.p1 GENE.NODE_596_length_719_cov_331.228041_g587_i0~~NODE_596_length_719_cov_331.228041_g587_i0.p1  ORF type:complete len:88 (+),score=14.87 NODE_596_length_719_cov_331.228041_g587_i0:115-378(+)